VDLVSATCDYAACDRPAAKRRDGWLFCRSHASRHRVDVATSAVDVPPPASQLIDDWIVRMHAVGLSDLAIARVVSMCDSAIGMRRRRLGLPAHHGSRQLATIDRQAREGDARISHCATCHEWQWDGQCGRCAVLYERRSA
jgi:hypothetical protein